MGSAARLAVVGQAVGHGTVRAVYDSIAHRVRGALSGPAGATVALLCFAASVATVTFVFRDRGFIDLDVYRAGGQAILSGSTLYEQDGREVLFPTAGKWLPFTYPPAAAVVFVPFALMSRGVGLVVLTCVFLAALALVLRLVILAAFPHTGARPALVVAVLLAAVSPVFEPVRDTLSYGQINIVLMALVAADVLVRAPRWPRGVLVGIAIAIKLTPAVFLLYFLVRRDWRALFTAAGATVAMVALGFVVRPRDSVTYWTDTLLHTDRIGVVAIVRNQSINGTVARYVEGSAGTALWLALSLLVVLVAAVAIHRRHGQALPALLLTAATALLISPVSWTHHWVWALPAMVWAASRVRTAVGTVAVLAFAAVFVIGPHWWVATRPDELVQPGLLPGIVAAIWVLLAAAAVVVAAVRPAPTPENELQARP